MLDLLDLIATVQEDGGSGCGRINRKMEVLDVRGLTVVAAVVED